MRLYAQSRARATRQVVGDLSVLLWVAGCALLARAVHRAVDALAGPVERTATTAGKIRDDLATASEQAGRVPVVGTDLSRPFASAAGSLADLVQTAGSQAEGLHRLATVLAVAVFAVPVSVVLVAWLTRRVRFVRAAGAAQRYVDSSADLDLFALRAMANQPLPVLARISADPVQAWRDGDRGVVRALADAELRRVGLRPPVPPTAEQLD